MVGKEPRTPRSQAELRGALIEQVTLLTSYCEHHDRGELVFAKPMATALRVLLHQTRSSHSLLGQLGLRSGRYFTVAPPLNPRNLMTECNLTFIQLRGTGEASYLPQLQVVGGRAGRLPFPEWWSRPIVKGRNARTMSRMDIVCAVADMDGGAHVDPSLTKLYESFRSGELLGWQVVAADQEGRTIHSPQYACIRAIAHELLLTLQNYARWAFKQLYAVEGTVT